MAYSYDQHRPVWIDSARMGLDDQADALRSCAPTVHATLDDQPDHPWLGSVAAASQAPRIPRSRQIIGTSQQGRVVHRAGDIPQPTEPCMSELDWVRFDRRVLYPVCVLALLVLLFASLAGCGGGSASDDEVAAHDAEMTVQPVRCLECKQ